MSYITTPVDDLQRQAESIESKVTQLNAIYEDYEDVNWNVLLINAVKETAMKSMN